MTKISSVLFILTAGLVTSLFFPLQAADAAGELWTAQWITAPGVAQKDEVILHFRKIVALPAVPSHFYVQVSGDNQFILHVNQQLVGRGPARSDLAHWKFETFDLAPFLHPGSNVLAATVWNFGTHAAVAQMSDRIGFLMHGVDDTARAADTDATWDVVEEKGIHTIPPSMHDYYAAGPGQILDAQRFDWVWDATGRHGDAWQKAVLLGRGSLRGETDPPNNWQLVEDSLPPMEMRQVPAGKLVRATGLDSPPQSLDQSFTIPAHAKAALLIDNLKLTTGYPALTALGPGSRIRLTYAEALFDDAGQKGNRNDIERRHIEGLVDEFLPAGDPREFIPLEWRTWRFLQLDIETGDQPVVISSLKTWFSAFPFAERASFSSDDPALTSIWDIGWWTARLDAHDTYMDTPYWERLQYIGDTRIQALISYVVAGDDRLARQSIQAFNNSRFPDGLTQSRYPSSLVQIIPTFSLLWVDMLHDFWLYRGDADFVRSQLAGTRTVLDWYLDRQRSDGLISKLPWWPFVDWGKDFESGMPPQAPDGGSSIITLQFVEALRNAAELESAFGSAQRAETYRRAATRAAQAVWSLCRNPQYGLIADDPSQQHYSQHANILAVWLDVVPRSQQQEVLEKILSTTDPGFHTSSSLPPMTAATYYFRFYLARALLHAGMGDRYLQLLGPWRQMISLGLTTWAESPEPTRSDSHAWSSHPNFDLLTIVAGLRPKSPGFASLTLEPHLGPLHHAEAAVPTPKGVVEVSYRRQADTVAAQITLPPSVSGELVWKGKVITLHSGHQTLTLPDHAQP